MKHFARILILITLSCLGTYYGPALVHLLLAERQRVPVVFYSPDSDEFLFFRYEGGEVRRVDQQGKIYSREEFEALLPLMHAAQLIKDGRIPETISGWAWDPAVARRARINMRLRAHQLDTPLVPLFPLYESESGRVRIETPREFVRLCSRVEVVDAKSNRLDGPATAAIQKVFDEAAFQLPVRLVGGNPTTLKPYDEGYYLVDREGDLFHLQKRRGQPFLLRVPLETLPGDRQKLQEIDPVFLLVQEHENRLIRVLVIGSDGEVFAVSGPDYIWQPVHFENYDPSTMDLSLRGDVLNLLFSVAGAEHLEAVVLNRDFCPAARHEEPLPGESQKIAGRVINTLFPFVLDLESANSGYLNFSLKINSPSAFGISSILAAAWAVFLFRRRQWRAKRIAEVVLVAMSGVVGLIAVNLLPR
jgi:hypothetical protein